jgi:hypothetical protein
MWLVSWKKKCYFSKFCNITWFLHTEEIQYSTKSVMLASQKMWKGICENDVKPTFRQIVFYSTINNCVKKLHRRRPRLRIVSKNSNGNNQGGGHWELFLGRIRIYIYQSRAIGDFNVKILLPGERFFAILDFASLPPPPRPNSLPWCPDVSLFNIHWRP